MSLEFKKYNDYWYKCFEIEKNLLLEKLKGFNVGSIEHIGATSVVLCDTLGTIDILVGINDPAEFPVVSDVLSKNGYELVEKGSSKVKLFFVRRDEKGIVGTIRVVVNGGPLCQRYIAFRDYLRSNKHCAIKYNLYRKTALESCNNDLHAYNKTKANFIESILQEYCEFK